MHERLTESLRPQGKRQSDPRPQHPREARSRQRIDPVNGKGLDVMLITKLVIKRKLIACQRADALTL